MRRVSIFAAVVLLLAAQVSSAQNACTAAFAEAQKSYDIGEFAQTASLLRQDCARARLSRTVAIQVQSLLARALMYAERPDEAKKEVSKLLRLEPGFDDATGSPRFAALLAEVRREEQSAQVTSVSKSAESLREAPATVVVVTGDEIERRGYLDLEQLLHDLPGFDVNRTNGDIYSHVYQRGYYDAFNSRLLLLIDGVEQNDLTQGTQYLSRQYPLTNIDRVEVVYGPASTMYGANAYTGVISIITRDAGAFLENKPFGLAGHVTTGGYGSTAADMTAAGITGGGTVAWSIAGRFQDGKERDLSKFDDWDYTYRNLDYGKLPTLKGVNAAGLLLARQTDQAFIQQNHLGFNDRAKNWGVNAKVQISNVTLGLQSWRSQEGVASAYGAQTYGGNTTYTPEETALYLRYSSRLSMGTLNIFTRYRQSSIDPNSSEFDLMAIYANGILDSSNLLPRTCGAAVCPPTAGILFPVNGRALSTQIRSEVSMAWQPSETLSGVTGVEFAKSTIQSQYDQFSGGSQAVVSSRNFHTDTALWGQGAWKPRPSLRFVAAGRLSYNKIDDSTKTEVSGFGSIFTPRLGVIYSPGRRQLVLKAVYSEAFKDPTDTEKFGGVVFPRFGAFQTSVNVNLRPERVRNTEVSAGWEADERTSVQLAAYRAHYTGVIAIRRLPSSKTCPNPCVVNQNRDEILVRGLELTARHKIAAAQIWANYTHVQPEQRIPSAIDPNAADPNAATEAVRVPNIASDQINAGVDEEWRQLTAAIRMHYSGPRKIGRGTAFVTFPDNPGPDAYATTAVSLTYRDLLPKLSVQLLADNVFDKQYRVVGSESLPSVLQNGRTVSVRMIYRLK
ncbi:MAG: TonB-dependent receptor plug domain-containing protein [Acidobacteria bacterium]|nr:TonB-dependent receptor plug domain-containing protein [Acidobacteriota bacterium]MBV9068554.1 TonB-dependent receptor plug domain-containing protein [Acidobacteriota bacterium]MBV9186702.1 TonB-dependent receptor plug domain-containing protein [Acidobacteriota bacterium]